MNTKDRNPPEQYRALVFQDLPADADVLVDAAATVADLARDKHRYQCRRRARDILDRDSARTLAVQVRGRRAEAVAALQQSASPDAVKRLGTLRGERGLLVQRCEARAETLDCETLIEKQRERCRELALSSDKHQGPDYETALDQLANLTARRGQRDAAIADENRERARIAQLDAQIADAEAALLIPENMRWDAERDYPQWV
jgi:predicted transcriptional regulator